MALVVVLSACNSSSVKDAIDVADGVPRKTINTEMLGANAFANDGRFGSISSQFRDVRDTLGLEEIRILFGWDDNVQPTPQSALNFSFYDDLVAKLPPGVRALIVVRGVPSWVSNPSNWVDGNPRTTFIEDFVRPCVQRYGSDSQVVGFQIWNEPNMPSSSNPDNGLLDLELSPVNYVEMLARAFSIVQDLAPSKLVVSAATTAINQNYPATLNYNKDMLAAGAEDFLDVWGVHYYGKQYENVIRSGGVQDFLNGLTRQIWITESGAQGVNSQLAYGEEVWPFLMERVPGIARIYVYQYTEATPADVSYGLRTLDPSFPVSDLYIHLRERNAG